MYSTPLRNLAAEWATLTHIYGLYRIADESSTAAVGAIGASATIDRPNPHSCEFRGGPAPVYALRARKVRRVDEITFPDANVVGANGVGACRR